MIPFRTVSGRRIDLEHPRPEDVVTSDIACGLSKICRFTGQLRQFYSVAQHSCFVAAVVPRELKRAALFHDASEAYLNDLSRGLKHSPFLDGYRTLEERWRVNIDTAMWLYLTPAQTRTIKVADDLAAVWERVVLRNHQNWYVEGDREIARSVEEHWVGSTAAEMRAISLRVPEAWTPLCCDGAEYQFLVYEKMTRG